MSNSYFDTGDYTTLVAHTLARGGSVNAIFSAVEAGFDKLPDSTRLAEGRVTFASADTGSADAYEVNLPGAPTQYNDGLYFIFRPANTNLTIFPTIDVQGIGAKIIRTYDFSNVAIGVLAADGLIPLCYDAQVSGQFRIMNS